MHTRDIRTHTRRRLRRIRRRLPEASGVILASFESPVRARARARARVCVYDMHIIQGI